MTTVSEANLKILLARGVRKEGDKYVVPGPLDLEGTGITSLPEGLIVGGGLYLRGTGITTLPEGLTVGGYLDLRGTGITTLPEGLIVGGSLDLEGTGITTLPEGLIVGGSLDLEGTGITSLPEGLTVGGYLDLRGTGITSLPEGLIVGGGLYLRGTGITTLPEGLIVGGGLYLRGTGIDASRVNHTIPEPLSWHGERYLRVDGILSEVLRRRDKVLEVCRVGARETSYIVTDGQGRWAHGDTIAEAKGDLLYKIANRDKSAYKGLTPESVLSKADAITAYRVITGACAYGTRDYMEHRLREDKDEYTIAEIIRLTEGEYGHEAFRGFFLGSASL